MHYQPEETISTERRKDKNVIAIWIVLIVALVVRILYLSAYARSPFFLVPMWDAGDYHQMSLSLSHGVIPSDLAFRPPLYPIVLSVIYMLFGAGSLMPRLIQIGLGSWSCVLVMLIAGRLFGRKWGIAAGVFAALSGLMVYFDLELLPTTLVVFLELLFINELLKISEPSFSPVKAGLWFSLGALARPIILAFLPFAVLWIVFSYLKKTPKISSEKKSAVQNTVKFSLAAVLPLLLSLLLHIAGGAGAVLVSAQGGVNFYIGSHPGSDGMTANLPGVGAGWGWDTVRQMAESRRGKPLNAAEVDEVFWEQGKEVMRGDFGRFIRRAFRKAGLFWNHVEISNNRDIYYHARSYPLWGILLKIGFPLLLPLALMGIVLNWRSMPVKLLTVYILVYYAAVIPFFVNARFRHPLMPLLIILAVGGVSRLLTLIRAKEWRRGTLTAGVAFLLGLLMPYMVNSGVNTNRGDYGLFTEGMAMKKLGRPSEAERFYHAALKQNPRAPFVNFDIAEMAREARKFKKAAEYYRRELEIQPQYAKAWNNLGVTWIDLGEEGNALSCFEKALAIQPGLAEASGNAGRILIQRAVAASSRDDWAGSAQWAERALAVNGSDLYAKVLLLEAQYELGAGEEVTTELLALIRQHPEFAPVQVLLKKIETMRQ